MDGHKTYLDGQWTKLDGTVGKPKTFKPRVTNQVNTCECTQLLWIMCKLKTTNPGLSVSFNSPVTNLLFFVQIVSTAGQFTCNIKDTSNILGHNSCYKLLPLLTVLWSMSHYIVSSGWTVLVGKSGQTVDKAGWEIVVELSYVESEQGSTV